MQWSKANYILVFSIIVDVLFMCSIDANIIKKICQYFIYIGLISNLIIVLNILATIEILICHNYNNIKHFLIWKFINSILILTGSIIFFINFQNKSATVHIEFYFSIFYVISVLIMAILCDTTIKINPVNMHYVNSSAMNVANIPAIQNIQLISEQPKKAVTDKNTQTIFIQPQTASVSPGSNDVSTERYNNLKIKCTSAIGTLVNTFDSFDDDDYEIPIV